MGIERCLGKKRAFFIEGGEHLKFSKRPVVDKKKKVKGVRHCQRGPLSGKGREENPDSRGRTNTPNPRGT